MKMLHHAMLSGCEQLSGSSIRRLPLSDGDGLVGPCSAAIPPGPLGSSLLVLLFRPGGPSLFLYGGFANLARGMECGSLLD
jgi:hypothetical protein